jgi:hypothetical protein
MASTKSSSELGEDLLPHTLLPAERFWVNLQPFLLARGYRLRPRYDPNWKPSWLTEDGQRIHVNGKYFYEDSLTVVCRIILLTR